MMASFPRLVLSGIPHHIAQRGNRRERTFFEDGDSALDLDLLAQAAEQAHTEIWSYCLIPNHVHIIAVPSDEDGLRRTFRSVALNHVRARLVKRPEDRCWPSVNAHFTGANDHVVNVTPTLEPIGDFRAFLGEEFDEAMSYAALRKAESVGRPIGSKDWLADMEATTGLTLAPQKRGPKASAK